MHKRLYTKWHLNKNVAWSYATYLVLILPAISQESTLFFFQNEKLRNNHIIKYLSLSLPILERATMEDSAGTMCVQSAHTLRHHTEPTHPYCVQPTLTRDRECGLTTI